MYSVTCESDVYIEMQHSVSRQAAATRNVSTAEFIVPQAICAISPFKRSLGGTLRPLMGDAMQDRSHLRLVPVWFARRVS